MKKITELTEEQKQGMVKWRDHCLNIGRDIGAIDKVATEEVWCYFYKKLNIKKPMFWYCQSPYQAQIVINFFKKNIGDNIGDNIRDNIGDNIRGNIRENIGDNIRDNIRDNIWDNIRDNIGDNIGDNIRGNIRDNIRGNIRDNIGDNIRGNIERIPTYSWCQHDIGWIGYYLYFYKYGLLKTDDDSEIVEMWYKLSKSCGWCYNFENLVVVCEKPCELNINDRGELHRDGGLALKYSDGYGLYMLNGVSVPKYLAVTPAGNLDVEFFKKEKNADVKAEFIRKYGIDRMMEMGKVIDTYKKYNNGEWWERSGYTLIDMSPIFESIDYAPHIKMVNQTIEGLYHLEAVAPECKSLEDALVWRENTQKNKYKTIDIK